MRGRGDHKGGGVIWTDKRGEGEHMEGGGGKKGGGGGEGEGRGRGKGKGFDEPSSVIRSEI